MSKVGDWVIEMQDDCIYLTREQFMKKHGERYVYIWDKQLGVVPQTCVEYSEETKGEN